jgi:hypothetical protein
MRDVLRNPIFYYILAPILFSLWPLSVWRLYLPRTEQALELDFTLYDKADACMKEIWRLDPDRANVSATSSGPGVFSPGEAVSRVADRCRIASRNYTCIAGGKTSIGGKEIQEAKVTLSDVDVVQSCSFLSRIQSTWVNLECKSVKLTKKEGAPDRWDVDMDFRYTY